MTRPLPPLALATLALVTGLLTAFRFPSAGSWLLVAVLVCTPLLLIAFRSVRARGAPGHLGRTPTKDDTAKAHIGTPSPSWTSAWLRAMFWKQ
jgi:hypothetical protein